MRNGLLAIILIASSTHSTPAQGWAEKMFKEGVSHDFGVVPHGALLFHRFTVTNIYAVRMEIRQPVPECGCVTATPVKRVLEPRESTTIDVEMDARKFTGLKKVIIRVSVGPDFVSTAELVVTATSRADIVFNPGQVTFDTVARGQTPTRTVDVEYAGKLAWQVSEVSTSKEAPFAADFKELYRRPGQVGYQVKVTLKPDAAPGTFKEFVYLKTNDPNAPLVPVLVDGSIQSALEVAPSTLSLGTVKTGETLTRRVSVQFHSPGRMKMKTKRVPAAAAVAVGAWLACMAVASAQTSAPPAAAADKDQHRISDQDIDLMRKDIRSQKKQLIAQNLKLTDTEATKFWPIYDQYTAELVKVNNKKYATIQQYADRHGTLTDEQATSLMKQWMDVDIAAAQLRAKYLPIVSQAIGGKKGATFAQLDRRVSLMIELQLASQVPLVQSQ